MPPDGVNPSHPAPTFCYYSVDVFHYLLVNRGEPLFVVHHLAVLIMLATAMWTGRQALFPVYITTLLEVRKMMQTRAGAMLLVRVAWT